MKSTNNVLKKILDIKSVNHISTKLNYEGKKIVLCHGDFDVLHTGHLKYFSEAKKKGDILIISVTGKNFIKKGPGRPINDDHQRLIFLANLEIVDYVVLDTNFNAVKIIQNIKPKFYVKGSDYYLNKKNDFFSKNLQLEKKVVERYGGQLYFTKNKTRSSSNIINNLFLKKEIIKKIDKLKKNYNYENFIEDIESFKNLKILVIGETIVDEYVHTNPLGKPSKENIIATEYIEKQTSLGGVFTAFKAFNVFSDNVDCITSISEQNKRIFKNTINTIKNKKLLFASKINTTKTRFIDKSHKKINKLFEVYKNTNVYNSIKIEKKICNYLNKDITKYDLVLVNDYGHGFFTDKIIKILVKKSKFLSVNTQINAGNKGFNLITKYKNAHFTCIDEMEAMRAVNRNDLDIKKLINKLHKIINSKNICVTLGSRGSCIQKQNKIPIFFPALTNSVVDTISAGDIFFVISSIFLQKKRTNEIATFFGNVAGSLAVNKENSSSFSSKEVFMSYVESLMK
jgi:rfaE bifunctional protein nucleotidyltransferase chain/domain